MTPYEALAKHVGPLAKPVDWSACLTWDRRDVVYCDWKGEAVVRVTPQSTAVIKVPKDHNRVWLNSIGAKLGIHGIYERRDARHKQHRVIVYNGGKEQKIPHGELMLPGVLTTAPANNENPNWHYMRLTLDDIPAIPTYATDKKKVKTVNAAIRLAWKLHELTYKMLEGSPEAKPRADYWHSFMNRVDHAKALLNLNYDMYLKISGHYGSVEGAINSCRLELKELSGCISNDVEVVDLS